MTPPRGRAGLGERAPRIRQEKSHRPKEGKFRRKKGALGVAPKEYFLTGKLLDQKDVNGVRTIRPLQEGEKKGKGDPALTR